MKRLALALAIALGAFYLQAQDSPLVAAAKASKQSAAKKSAKKKIVITNETLAKSGGHVSTSTSTPAPLPKLTNPPQTAAAPKPAAVAKTDEDKKKRDAERANAIYEGDDAEGIYEDPARTEGRMEKVSPAAPQQPPTVQTQQPTTVQSQKPPAD